MGIQKMITKVIVRLFVLIVLIGAVGAQQARASIFIHEILADPPTIGGDANRDGVVSSTQDEFVELYNNSNQAVDISGWVITDDLRQRHVFASGTWINPFGLWVVFGGGTPILPGNSYSIASSGGLGLNNTNDIVSLFNAEGILMDQVIYGAEGGKDQSLVRFSSDASMVLYSTISDTEKFGPGVFRLGADDNAQAVPEPATAWSIVMGIAGLLLQKRKTVG
jgi:hypothetical protein